MIKHSLLVALFACGCVAARAQAPTATIDDMAMVLGTVGAVKQSCAVKMSDVPLKTAVEKFGLNYTDFAPGGKHAGLVRAKTKEQADFIHMLGIDRGCAALHGILRIYLPDIYQ
jgi:hypothetical protein